MTGRTLERLESRYCLSAAHHGGGDFHFHFSAMQNESSTVGGVTAVTAEATHAPLQRSTLMMRHRGMTRDGQIAKAPVANDDYVNNDGVSGNDAAVPVARPQPVAFIGINVPGLGVVLVPLFNAPAGNSSNAPVVNPATPAGEKGTTTTATVVQTPANAIAVQPNVATRDGHDASNQSAARELLAETDSSANRIGVVGGMLATATMPVAMRTFATNSASAVIDRLTSQWHDGIIAAAVADVAQSSFAHLVASPQALVARAVDAASNLLAPAAQTAAEVASAITPAVATVANAAAYDIAHMGSPFALLADSLAGFVDESATVGNVVAQADKRGPWALTAGVIAADVVVLTYVYRRKSTRRRAQLAMMGAD